MDERDEDGGDFDMPLLALSESSASPPGSVDPAEESEEGQEITLNLSPGPSDMGDRNQEVEEVMSPASEESTLSVPELQVSEVMRHVDITRTYEYILFTCHTSHRLGLCVIFPCRRRWRNCHGWRQGGGQRTWKRVNDQAHPQVSFPPVFKRHNMDEHSYFFPPLFYFSAAVAELARVGSSYAGWPIWVFQGHTSIYLHYK